MATFARTLPAALLVVCLVLAPAAAAQEQKALSAPFATLLAPLLEFWAEFSEAGPQIIPSASDVPADEDAQSQTPAEGDSPEFQAYIIPGG